MAPGRVTLLVHLYPLLQSVVCRDPHAKHLVNEMRDVKQSHMIPVRPDASFLTKSRRRTTTKALLINMLNVGVLEHLVHQKDAGILMTLVIWLIPILMAQIW
jgi:hypothetical protein